MRAFKRRLLDDPRCRVGFAWLIASYVKLVYRTSRWESIGAEAMVRRREAGQPFLCAFWHGRMLLQPYAWDKRYPIQMLISGHRDGLVIAEAMRFFGVDVIAGSSSSGGAQASRSVFRHLKQSGWVALTPDGPRGPRMRASLGIVRLAARAGVPIQPGTFSVARRRVLRTWDRFVLAWPCNRGVFIYGPMIEVPADADERMLEAKRRELEDCLNRITAEADRMLGHPSVEPAPEPEAATP